MPRGFADTIYNALFKRTTTYVPMLFIGSYLTNEAIDYGVQTFWKSHNRGKSFEDMLAAREAA
ncbi:ubiquinol:cytochrome c oxidoreductase 7 kDa subunit [Haematococcus lacustris]